MYVHMYICRYLLVCKFIYFSWRFVYKPVDIDLSSYDVGKADNHEIRYTLEYFSSFHYMRGSQMEPKLSATAFPVFDIWHDDFETKPKK